MAQHHLRLLLPRDNPPFRPRSGCFGDPTKEKEQLRNSSLSDRSRENSRRPQGMRRTPPVSAHVCRCNIGARAALTRSTGLTSRANGLRAARVCAARAAYVFTALVPALCAHQAGALPRKFRRSSHSTAVTARNLQLHSHAQRAGPSTCLLCVPSGCSHPHSPVQRSFVLVRHRKNKLLVVLLVFVLLDCLAAHAICLNILRLHRHLRVLARVAIDLSMKCCCTVKCPEELHVRGERAKF